MDEKVVILMSTYNGEQYIREQLESIIKQKYRNWKLLVRDDGSTDETPIIIEEYSNKYDNIIFVNQGKVENKGFNDSFFALIREGLSRDPDCNYFAFADQDDVWFENKVSSAMKSISQHCKDDYLPYVYYYANKSWTNESLEFIHEDNFALCRDNYFDMFILPPVYGCTSVISRKLAEKALEPTQPTKLLYDVYLYRLACLLGGVLISDRTPQMFYRRHGNNASGDAMKFSFIRGLKKYLSKPSDMHGAKKYIDELYNKYSDDINGEQRKLCLLISDYERSFSHKLRLLTWKQAHNRGVKASVMWIGRVVLNAI